MRTGLSFGTTKPVASGSDPLYSRLCYSRYFCGGEQSADESTLGHDTCRNNISVSLKEKKKVKQWTEQDDRVERDIRSNISSSLKSQKSFDLLLHFDFHFLSPARDTPHSKTQPLARVISPLLVILEVNFHVTLEVSLRVKISFSHFLKWWHIYEAKFNSQFLPYFTE